MKKISDERIKFLLKNSEDEMNEDEFVKALQELLELRELKKEYRVDIENMRQTIQKLRQSQPKYHLGQKVWLIYQSATQKKWVVDPEQHQIVKMSISADSDYSYYELDYKGDAYEKYIFPTRALALEECRKRNGEKK